MLRAIFFDLDNTLADRDAVFHRYRTEAGESRVPDLPDTASAEMVRARPGGNGSECWRGNIIGPGEWRHVANLYEPDPAILALICRLATRYRLAVVTNGSSANQRRKLARLELADSFDAVVISGRVGVAKPRSGIFHAACRATACIPGEVLFVGNDPLCDVAGAAAAGMSTCWVSRGDAWPTGFPPPDYAIGSVLELEQILP